MALCLLALATSASAESAWVLWKYEALLPPDAKSTTAAWGPVKQIQWTNMGVKSNRKDCEESLAKTPAPTADVYHVCFPDTVAERGAMMSDAHGLERQHVANIDVPDFYASALGDITAARTLYNSLSGSGVEETRTAKVILNQAARMVWLADRIQDVSAGRPALPITFFIIAAEAVAKLADGYEDEGKSRHYVRRFFFVFCTEDQRRRAYRALQWAVPLPQSPDEIADYLYSIRCNVVHEGRYFEMSVPSDACVGEVRAIVLEGAANAAQSVAARGSE